MPCENGLLHSDEVGHFLITSRRLFVKANVRGRDIGSFVKEAQAVIGKEVQIPAGYYLTYGGQFENLQRASARLLIVVPLALFLIFILLFSTFGSVRQAILIYSGIPFAIVGGIFALLLRGMPSRFRRAAVSLHSSTTPCSTASSWSATSINFVLKGSRSRTR